MFNGYSMLYANVGGIRDPLKQDLALEFCRKQNKYISILSETHNKHDQILRIRNNWLGPIFLSPGSSHAKGLIAQLHPGLEGATEVDTDPKGKFYNKEATFKTATTEFLNQIPNRRNISNEQFHLCEAKIL